MPSVVTANDLRSGAVVYLGRGEHWVAELGDAEVAHDTLAAGRQAAIADAAAAANIITAVYAMDVAIVDGRPTPVSVRETIRAAHSPTV